MTVFKYIPPKNSIFIPSGETLRYMGIRGPVPKEFVLKARHAEEQIISLANPMAVFCVCTVKISGDITDLSFTKIKSQSLASLLTACDHAVVFAATAGASADRAIISCGKFSIAQAQVLDSAASAYTESLCDNLCRHISACDFAQGKTFTSRFSPGYGDVPLTLQQDIFSLLDCPKNIGLTLTDSLLMVPSKSVTAIMGLTDEKPAETCTNSCEFCNLKTCLYRKEENL